MFEHRTEPLLPWREFVKRLLKSAALGFVMVTVCLAIGILGYHVLGRLAWLDAMVNASMILGGMGPVDPIATTSGKVFESVYALFSGVAFITSIGVFLAPAVHRLLHALHLEVDAE
ncbi:MAG: hypothetical protein HYR73_02195 [Candidatus Eisenbacteria bacterium]|nr:hypothetical protein [Candidatus Eisenbacteria bacterium]